MTGAPAEQGAHEPEVAEPTPVAGPLLAVCGLCGGAGASTLAYLVARHAAREAEAPVLVCDTGGPTGGLAAYAGAESPRTLPRIADAVAAHEPLAEGLFADAALGLRVIAGGPELDTGGDADGAARVLGDARVAHRLTVVDCGIAHGAIDRVVLEAASHVAWVLPATHSGVRRARRVIELFGVEAGRREVVVARADASARNPPTDDLKALAAARTAPLALMPHVPDLGEAAPADALAAAALTMEAIEGFLAR